MDHEGFHILNSIIQHIPFEHFQGNLPTIFNILFSRLHKKKTAKFIKCLVLFFSLFIIQFGTDTLINYLEKLQKGLFLMISPLWFEFLPKVSGIYQRKLCSIATIKLLTESKIIISDYLEKDQIYYQFFFSLLKLLELPEETIKDEKEEEEISSEYQVKHSKLSFASPSQLEDPVKGFASPKKYLVLNLQKFNQELKKKIFSSLPKEASMKLLEYFRNRVNRQLFKVTQK